MSMSVSGGGGSMKSEPNIVPLCDILLVLLIIFMVVTPMVQKGVDVKLPEASVTKEQPENPPVTLAIKKDGTVYLNTDIISDRTTLKDKIADAMESSSDPRLYFKADRECDYSAVMDVLDYAMNAGVEDVGIITEQSTSGEGQ